VILEGLTSPQVKVG